MLKLHQSFLYSMASYERLQGMKGESQLRLYWQYCQHLMQECHQMDGSYVLHPYYRNIEARNGELNQQFTRTIYAAHNIWREKLRTSSKLFLSTQNQFYKPGVLKLSQSSCWTGLETPTRVFVNNGAFINVHSYYYARFSLAALCCLAASTGLLLLLLTSESKH